MAYQALNKTADSAHWLQAAVEARNGSAAYMRLGEQALDAGQADASRAAYQLAATLLPATPNSSRVSVHAGLASTALLAKDNAEATSQMRVALQAYRALPIDAALGSAAHEAVLSLLQSARRFKLFDTLRPELVLLPSPSPGNLGGYQLLPLLEGLSLQEVQTIILCFIAVFGSCRSAGTGQMERGRKRSAAARRHGPCGTGCGQRRPSGHGEPLHHSPTAFATTGSRRKDSEALRLFDALPVDQRPGESEMILLARARSATSAAAFRTWLESSSLSDTTVMRQVAMKLLNASNPKRDVAQELLQASYTQDLANDPNAAAAYLGLAELRFDQGRPDEAMALLQRVHMTVGEPFAWHDAIATLLLKKQKAADAATMLASVAAAEPWNSQLQLLLAEANLAKSNNQDASGLETLARDAQGLYASRLRAAQLLGASGKVLSPELPAKELAQLASTTPLAADADAAFHTKARSKVVAQTKDPVAKLKVLRNWLADDPQSEEARHLLFLALSAGGRRKEANAIALAGSDGRQMEDAMPADRLVYIQNLLALGETNMASDEMSQAISKLTASDQPEVPAAYLQLRRRIADQLAMETANQQRRPFINEGTSQGNLVRPRVTLAMLASGGAQ